jgi:hypothetical protein
VSAKALEERRKTEGGVPKILKFHVFLNLSSQARNTTQHSVVIYDEVCRYILMDIFSASQMGNTPQ